MCVSVTPVKAEAAGEAHTLTADPVEAIQLMAQSRAEARDADARQTLQFRIASASCGARHSVALTTTGRVFTWGGNAYGQLGLGDRVDRSSPCLVSGMLRSVKVVTVAAGLRSTLALTRNDGMFEWGCAGAVAETELRPLRGLTMNPREPETYLQLVDDLLPRPVISKVRLKCSAAPASVLLRVLCSRVRVLAVCKWGRCSRLSGSRTPFTCCRLNCRAESS
jgi:hypothetical protein